ncbi:hypothetical protein C8R43DRAFT_989131 [Mycena crocata]|nr:hypothetical protein C8R43DRAFT_989131 [Mycena crocata]
MSLASIGEYLLFLVCLELPLVDIHSLRQACRAICDATRTKVLWIGILERKIHDEGIILPLYLKTYDLLDAVALETLVRRVSTLTDKWKNGNLSPAHVRRLYIPQSITWLRLVSSIWLFVASSDNHSSKISCWNISLVSKGNEKPLAEAYLPGQVKTGKLEVQGPGIVLALGLQNAETQSVLVITLRQHLGRHAFCELSHIENSSHVLMLSGNFIGCVLRHGAIAPHVVQWKENHVYDIPSPPGDLDIPGRRSAPHLMTTWGDVLVIIRKNDLEFYTLPGDSVSFLKLIKTPTIWEAAVCHSPPSISSDRIPPLRLMAISLDGIVMYVLERTALADFGDDPLCPSVPLAKLPRHTGYREPWYNLGIGETGRRSLWISETSRLNAPLEFVYMGVPLMSPDTELPARIIWSDAPDQLALWALPVVDFDDALGLTVVGNCFGELAIYDHVGGNLEPCARLSTDFTHQPVTRLLPVAPIPLGLSIAPRPVASYSEPNPSLIASWVKDDIDLTRSDQLWSRDWVSGYPGYLDWDVWQGAPCDFAWFLEHTYGFPGPVFPQAYAEDDIYDCQYLLFRSGNRYFVFASDPDRGLRSWPLGTTDFSLSSSQPQSHACLTARTAGVMYRTMVSNEIDGESGRTRNRWIEQAERGGRPHRNLLITS